MVPLALCAVVALSCQVKGGDFRCWANFSKLCPSCQSDISNWPRSEKSPMKGGSTYLRIGELLLLIIKLENLPWPRCRVPMLGKELKKIQNSDNITVMAITMIVLANWWWWVWKWKPEEWWWSSLRFLSNSLPGQEHGLCLVSWSLWSWWGGGGGDDWRLILKTKKSGFVTQLLYGWTLRAMLIPKLSWKWCWRVSSMLTISSILLM